MAALGTVVAWSPVLAQTAEAPLTGDVRHLTISPQIETTYDTNVAGTNAEGAKLRGLTPEDVIVQPSVTFDALMPVNREAIFLTGLVGYDFYDRNSVLNRDRINLTGGVSAQLFRCQPVLKGGYSRSQMRLAELLPGPNVASASPQNTSTVENVGVDLSCPRSQGFSPTASVTYATDENSSKFYQAINNHSTTATGGLSYARPGFGAIQTYGSFTSVAYDNPFAVPFPPFQLNSSYDLYAGGVRYSRPVGSRLAGTVAVAYTALRPSQSSRPGFSGVTYSSELTYKMSSRLGFHALVSRAMLPTNQVGASYIIDNARQIEASYTLGTRWSVNVGAYDDPQTYKGALVGKVSNLLTNGRTDRIFGAFNIALTRRLSVVLDAANEHRSSNFALYTYTSNRVSLTLKGVF